MPPQSSPFPLSEVALVFLEIPFVGTSPSKWLLDRFSNCKSKSSKNFGISPEKLLLERSSCLRPLYDSKDEGMVPWKKFLLMARNSSFTQLPRLIGFLLDNIFLEISKYPRFLKFPTYIGRVLVNWLVEMSKLIGENERPMTCGDMEPLRLS